MDPNPSRDVTVIRAASLWRPFATGHRVAFLLALMGTAAASATEPPLLVSPGGEGELRPVASSCPTFSWAPVGAADWYQIAVFPLDGEGPAEAELGDPVLLETLPGRAASWTPPGSACLEAGTSYLWSVRAVADAAAAGSARVEDWAPPRYFSLPAGPGPGEVQRALEVLRSAGLLDRASAVGAEDAAATAARRDRRAPAARSGRPGEGGPVRITAPLVAPDTTGLRARLAETAQVGFGVHGTTATTGVGSAGVVGEATATSGAVHGVVGVTHSATGAGGVFENAAGGPILSGVGAGGEVFTVGPTGTVTAPLFTGSGSGLSGVDWDSLANVPAEFEDGVDDDTTYDAGTGLELSGTTFRVTSAPMEMYIENQRVAFAGTAEDPSILIGRDGLPLIAFYDASSGELKVVHCKDTVCSQVSETTLDNTGIVGQHTDITLGRDGNALISYYDDTNNQLKLAHCQDVPCSAADLTVVDSDGDVGRYSSITTNSDGYAFIAYYDAAGALKATECTNLLCTSSNTWTVDSGNVGEHTSVARGFNGLGWISYYDAGNDALKLARCARTKCSNPALYTVDADHAGPHNDLTIGPDGHPLIAYSSSAFSGLFRIAHCENRSTCTTPDLTTAISGTTWMGIAITRGADGLPLMTATLPSTSRVYTFRCNDFACSDPTIADDTVNNGAVDAAVTIGSDRLPIIAYASDLDGDLYIAHCSDVSCQPYLREP